MNIKKAGAIIISKKNPHSILLIYRGKQKDWTFPKGHIEKDEKAMGTMQREVREETGIPIRFICELTPLKYIHPNGSHINISMFFGQSKNDTFKKEFVNDKLLWINYRKVINKLTYPNIKIYYQQIFPVIELKIKEINKELNSRKNLVAKPRI